MTRSPQAVMIQDVTAAMRRFDAELDLLDEGAAWALGIGRTDLRALEIISRGPVSATRLAAELRLTSGAVTTLVDRLVAKGLAVRNADPQDRRKVSLGLTPRGRAREARLFGPLGRRVGAVLGRYHPAELALILKFLESVTDVTEQHRLTIRR